MLDTCNNARRYGNDKFSVPPPGQARSGKATVPCPPLAGISGRPGRDRTSSVFAIRCVPREEPQNRGEKLVIAPEGWGSAGKRREGGLRRSSPEGRSFRWVPKPKANQPWRGFYACIKACGFVFTEQVWCDDFILRCQNLQRHKKWQE